MEKTFQRPYIPPSQIPDFFRAKWPLGLLGEGFVPFPKTAIRSIGKILQGEGAMDELAILLTIIDYKRPSVSRLPSVDYLAFTSGYSIEETTKILRRLEEKKLISMTKNADSSLSIDTQGFYERIAHVALTDPLAPDASTDSSPGR